MKLGPIHQECDAPEYPIVQACAAVGVKKPEDVRWIHADRAPATAKCSCGETLPRLAKFRFTYQSKQEAEYNVGQCQKCMTVYWEPCG